MGVIAIFWSFDRIMGKAHVTSREGRPYQDGMTVGTGIASGTMSDHRDHGGSHGGAGDRAALSAAGRRGQVPGLRRPDGPRGLPLPQVPDLLLLQVPPPRPAPRRAVPVHEPAVR